MAHLLGTRRGLEACASPRGTFTVLALDHRQNLRREVRPDDPATDWSAMQATGAPENSGTCGSYSTNWSPLIQARARAQRPMAILARGEAPKRHQRPRSGS